MRNRSRPRSRTACCMKVIAPNTDRSVPGSDSPSARRTRSISSTRWYSIRCCSSDSTSWGSSRRGPPASSCSAQATKYPETGHAECVRAAPDLGPLGPGAAQRAPHHVRHRSGLRRGAALRIGAAGDRSPALSGTRIGQAVELGLPVEHASTASPSAFQRSSSPMSAMRCSSILASSRSSRTARRKTVSGSGSGTVALCTM